MDAKPKPHDMRDEAYAPLGTKTDINDKLAGSPSAPKVMPTGNAKPAPKASGTSVTPGQASEG